MLFNCLYYLLSFTIAYFVLIQLFVAIGNKQTNNFAIC